MEESSTEAYCLDNKLTHLLKLPLNWIQEWSPVCQSPIPYEIILAHPPLLTLLTLSFPLKELGYWWSSFYLDGFTFHHAECGLANERYSPNPFSLGQNRWSIAKFREVWRHPFYKGSKLEVCQVQLTDLSPNTGYRVFLGVKEFRAWTLPAKRWLLI